LGHPAVDVADARKHLVHRLRTVIMGNTQCRRRLAMSEVTRILSAIEDGDPHAAAQLLPLVYDELRKLAAQKQQPT
jgi:DNA-binding GntR family transcriptional regulator